MTPLSVAIIDRKLEINWSSELVSGWLRKENNVLISHETIYRHIWDNKILGGRLYHSLHRKSKVYQSRAASQAGRGQVKNRVSLDERPSVVDDKSRVGDCKIDLVIGKGHRGALVTIVERKTSYTVLTRLFDKQAATVTASTIALLKHYKEAVLTFTADNGKEFACHE